MSDKIKGAAVGLFTGFLNGFFGSGGGTVAVPAMRRFMGVETKEAHATAIAVILPLSLVSAVMYIGGVGVDWAALAWVAVGGAAGGLIGAKLLHRIKPYWLRKLFGAVMLAASVRMIL